ncbi:ATP-binding protein [Aquimarina sp. 2201CG1-2-11]|uniref:PAS domain-containing sensor histidine kinase n=1 Tax=Aquimarina discodermiae TaxID=3231043 RepID=UPI003462AA78
MDTIYINQLLIFLLQGFIVAFLILLLFRLRTKIGLGLLFTTLGLFQFLQVFLASTLYFKITDTIVFSPGSSILFSASLFVILLIYIKEDAITTRKLIHALVITNIVLCFLLFAFRLNVDGTNIYNPFSISTEFFHTNILVLLIGTFILFLDSLLIIFLFEYTSKYISNLFLRILITMSLVLSFDAIFFSLGSFWYFEDLQAFLISGLFSKIFMSVFFSMLFSFYLKNFEKKGVHTSYANFKDVFHSLTYKQKFEVADKAMKLSKNRYHVLTNLVPVGIFMTDAQGKTTFVNPRWSSITGVPQENVINEGWLNAVHPLDRQKLQEEWYIASGKKKISNTEYRFLKPDGSVTWVLGQAIPEYNEKNQVIGYVGTITDITTIKLYELELNRLKDKAEESDRLKSAFLTNMSHEIRTPMNGILGLAELLNEPKLTGNEQQLYLELIKESGSRMLDIINDIIDISRIATDQVKVSTQKVAINEQIEQLFTLFKPQAENKNIDISISNGLTEKEAIITTDKSKFNAILANLVKNAIKYTDQGKIEFGYKKVLQTLEFYVKDTGIGIEKDRQEAIFDRFVQADLENRHAIEGAGIGLSIAKAYVEMLNGRIWLESVKGKGSIFYFTIPYHPII